MTNLILIPLFLAYAHYIGNNTDLLRHYYGIIRSRINQLYFHFMEVSEGRPKMQKIGKLS